MTIKELEELINKDWQFWEYKYAFIDGWLSITEPVKLVFDPKYYTVSCDENYNIKLFGKSYNIKSYKYNYAAAFKNKLSTLISDETIVSE